MARRRTDTAADEPEKRAEFHNDEQRNAYLDALATEKTGYQARLERADVDEDELTAKKMRGRIEQVEAEIARVEKAK